MRNLAVNEEDAEDIGQSLLSFSHISDIGEDDIGSTLRPSLIYKFNVGQSQPSHLTCTVHLFLPLPTSCGCAKALTPPTRRVSKENGILPGFHTCSLGEDPSDLFSHSCVVGRTLLSEPSFFVLSSPLWTFLGPQGVSTCIPCLAFYFFC